VTTQAPPPRSLSLVLVCFYLQPVLHSHSEIQRWRAKILTGEERREDLYLFRQERKRERRRKEKRVEI